MPTKKKSKTYKRWHPIPIYDARLLIVVTDDLRKSRALFDDTFGEGPTGGYTALASFNAVGDFAVFLPCGVSDNVLAHEVFHVTHRILDYTNCNFDAEHHEQGALLNGYLTEIVRKAVTSCKP